MRIADDVAEKIARDYALGDAGVTLAARYGIDASTVYEIVRRFGGHVRTQSEARTVYSIDESFFATIDSHVKAQILGFLFADGCLQVKESGAGVLVVTLAQADDAYLQWISDTLQSDRPIARRRTRASNGKTYGAVSFVTNNPVIVRDLQRVGMTPRKSLTLQFPSPAQVPVEFIGSFIRGYFEGDGCAYLSKPTTKCRTKRAKACFVGSWDFITALQRVLAERGIKSTTFVKTSRSGVRFLTMEINTLDDVMRFYDLIYAHAEYRMERKYAKFVEYKAQYREAKTVRDGKPHVEYQLINRNYSEDLRRRMSNMARAKAEEQFCRPIHLKSPQGVIYGSDMVGPFCAEMKIDRGRASLVARGLKPSEKGWTLPTESEISAARAADTLIEKRYRQPAAPAAEIVALPTTPDQIAA
jgi:hypothetical protein